MKFLVNHKIKSFLAFSAVIIAGILGYFSGGFWVCILTIMCTLIPLIIWIMDTVSADERYAKLDLAFKKLQESNMEIDKKNKLIEAKNRDIDSLNEQLRNGG